MNAKELRQAAERVSDQYHHDTTTIDPDLAVDIAVHIVATVSEDDDETYFSSWGREMLGATTLQLTKRFGLCTDSCDIEFEDGDSFDSLETTVRTRGDFRTLCRLLGVKLKEEE